MSNIQSVKSFIQSDAVMGKFRELLGNRAQQFATSLLQVVSNNDLLQKASPQSIYGAAITAAVLDLPINSNLGYAYIVPYKGEAQFQLGWKGFVQLALRTGQFLRINATDIREGEIVNHNRLTGEIEFSWLPVEVRLKANVIGYASYFRLINGFESTYYMTVDELKEHAKRYSQSYKKNYGVWIENFDAMALKTVIKLNLSKNAPLSIELKRAIEFDQAVTMDGETVEYVDNEDVTIDERKQSIVEKLDGLFDNNQNDEKDE